MDSITSLTILGIAAPSAYQASKVVAKVAEDFLKRVLAPAGDALGEIGAHPIRQWQAERVRRAEQVVAAAAKALSDAGLPAHAVPGRVLWPILEKASLEDESELLRAKWISLLANAAGPASSSVHPAFPQILSELSPLDCRVLELAFKPIKVTSDDSTPPENWVGVQVIPFSNTLGVLASDMSVLASDIWVSMANLARLQLIALPQRPFPTSLPGEEDSTYLMSGTADNYGNHYLTDFGLQFINACRAPGLNKAV